MANLNLRSVLMVRGIALLLGAMQAVAFAATPVLHFSDLNWGPKTGWEGSSVKGAAVTVWGENLGTSQGSSYITVNGAQLIAAGDYAEWGTTGPARGLQRITFWLNPNCADGAGTITVTVNGATSNALPFSVAAGTIYFVSPNGNNSNNGLYSTAQGGANGPFRDIYTFNFAYSPSGDGQYIVYVRGGTYTSQDPAGDSSMVSLRGPSGGPSKRKALVGYPAETPVIDATSMSRGAVWIADYSPYGRNSYLTFSKLTFVNGVEAIECYGDYIRIIGNHFQSMLAPAWSGIVFAENSQYNQYLGNWFDHNGATTDGSYKHNVYVLTTPLSANVASINNVIGWNEFSNPEAGSDNRGGVIFARTDSNLSSTPTRLLYIHDNYFHGGNQNAIEIGDGPPQSDIYIYNNVFNGGPSVNSTISILWTTANANLFNNTFYLAGSAGVSVVDVVGNSPGSHLNSANNVFYGLAGQPFFNVEAGGSLSSDHDFFYSAAGAPPPPSGSGLTLTNAITGDPLFVDAGNSDFHLRSGSPALNTGTSSVGSVVKEDFNGIPRPQGSGYDLGAFEYAAGGADPPPVSVTIAPTAVTLGPGGTQQFTATVSGSINSAVTWSMSSNGGTLSSSGLYTAPASISSQTTVTVTATAVADPTKSASAIVTLNPAITVTISPTTASLRAGQTQQFTASVSGTTNTAVTWSLSPAVGTLSSSGLYTAPSSITSQQTVRVTATSQADPTKSASATITLNPGISVTISPTTASLRAGQTQQFKASVSGTTNTAVTWSLSPAVGNLSSSGLYTAPSSITSQQTVRVTATSQADTTKLASATITLNPGISVSISPTTATPRPGQSQQFTASVNGTANTAVTWSLSPAVGTLSPSGLYTTPSSITSQQTVRVTAASQADATKAASATITLNPPATFSINWTAINGSQTRVTWTAPAGRPANDYITLTGYGSPDWWCSWEQNTGGATSGSFVVNTPTATGVWQFRYYLSGSRTLAAVTPDLPVGISPFSVVPTPTVVPRNAPLTVAWTAPSGRPSGWADIVGLYLMGAPNDQPVWTQYTMGATTGRLTLTAPATPGAYEFRYVMDYLIGAHSAPVTVP